MKIKSFWEANFLSMELILATVATLVFVAWSELVDNRVFLSQIFADNRQVLYGALTALFGSMLGFIITATSIVLGYANNERLEIVRQSKHYSTLWDVFKSAIRVLAFSTIISLIGLVLDKDLSPINFILYINIFAAILAFLRIARCIWVLENIIAIVTKPRS
jgi:hypothetical protein